MASFKACKLIQNHKISYNLFNRVNIITCNYLLETSNVQHECVRSASSNYLSRLGMNPRNNKNPSKRTLPSRVTTHPARKTYAESIVAPELAELRYKYPEFLPDPRIIYRNKLANGLERIDMMNRRNVIDIPEFYVGTLMAVTISDPYASGKVSRFVGLCIERGGQGVRAYFTLRNVVDHQGVEIRYNLYNPTIREIQVLKLEKRLDDHLLYLRDAPLEYSTFSFDTPPEVHPAGQPVPVNPLIVELKPFPWSRKWHNKDLKGIGVMKDVPDWLWIKSHRSRNFYEPFDLMDQYRKSVPEDDQLEIWEQVKKHEDNIAEVRKVERRKKLIAEIEKKSA